jgi:LAGLIDADG DNA endonuclease family
MYQLKIGDSYWNTRVEFNKGPSLLKLYLPHIKIIKQIPYNANTDKTDFSKEKSITRHVGRDISAVIRIKEPGSINRRIHPLSSFQEPQLEKSVKVDQHSPFFEDDLKKISQEEFSAIEKNYSHNEEIVEKQVNRDYKENPYLVGQIFGEGDMIPPQEGKKDKNFSFEAVAEYHGGILIKRTYYDFEERNYDASAPQMRLSAKDEYVYQMQTMHRRENVKEHFTVTAPHPDMNKILKDWYTASRLVPGGYRKKMAKDLRSYITEQTLAVIYMNVGIEWTNTVACAGLDLRKFELGDVFRFRNFLKTAYKIDGFVARATDARYVLVFFKYDYAKFLDLINPYTVFPYDIKMGTAYNPKTGIGYYGSRIEINKGPKLIRLRMEKIEILLEAPRDENDDEPGFSFEDL